MIKLNLGCGTDYRKGYINVDVSQDVNPDVLADVTNLHMYENNSVDVIESYHLFEHFTYPDALKCLREWYRILKPTGKMVIETPNLWECVDALYKSKNFNWRDLHVIGLYGYVPDIQKEGIFQVHKWGWVPWEIKKELELCGYKNITFLRPTQTHRPAYKTKRDMRVEAHK